MTYFAFEDGVSTAPVDGGVPISDRQYQDALDAIPSGREVTISGGFAVRDTQSSEHHRWEHGE